MVNVKKLDISKLDFHKGSPNKPTDSLNDQINGDEEKEDFDEIEGDPVDKDDDDEDEEEDDDSKTSEGGFIQALLRMQVQPRVKHYLPEFKHVFTDDIKMHDAFDCYGIHPGIPTLDYFKGGFMLKGNYKDVPIDEAKCLDISTNGIDFMAMSFAPEIMRAKVT